MQTRSSPNIQTLFRLAKQARLPGYEKMSKTTLFLKLQERFDIERLLRAEARSIEKEKSMKSKKRKINEIPTLENKKTSNTETSGSTKRAKLNTIDPIMLVPIGKKKTFKFMRPNGTVVRFNIESLVDYLLVSGDFTDPETRIAFSDEDLKEIDSIARKAGLQKSSVFEAKHNVIAYSDSKFRRDALLGLERCAGEVITDILQIVETYDPDEAQMQLVIKEFPAFLDYFRQLKDAEPEYASKCIAHWRLFMAGPPNRPNTDEYGLIHVVCHFLKSCDEGAI